MATKINATLTFDGGGNASVACYGSYRIELSNFDVIEAARIPLREAHTSNEAEYMTLEAALKDLVSHLRLSRIPPSSVVLKVYGDSQLVVRQINGRYRCKEPRMFALCERVCTLLNCFNAATKVDWHPRCKSVKAFGH